MPGSMVKTIPGFEHGWVAVGGIVYVDAEHVAEAVQPVLAERLAMQVFAVGVDVVVGGGVERVGVVPVAVVDGGLAGDECVDRGLLRAEHDVVDLALARR